MDSLNNDPFFASPPKENKALPPNEFMVEPQDGLGEAEDPTGGHPDQLMANNDNNNGIHVNTSGAMRGEKDVVRRVVGS